MSVEQVKPGYKRTEVGVIPEDWNARAIGNDIDLLTGYPFQSTGYTESGVRLLRGSNVKRGQTDWAEDITQCWPTISQDIARYELHEGDLVISMDGSLVGRSYAKLTKDDLPSLLLQRVARIRSTKHLDAGYLATFVGSTWFVRHADSVKTVTAIPHISPADICSFTIPIPPTAEEQQAIAAALLDVDALLAQLDQLIAKKRDLKQAAMQQLLTGQTRLPGFSGEWETKQLADLADVKTGPFGSSLHESDYVPDGTPIITVEHLGEFGVEHLNLPMVSELDCRRLKAYSLDPGDIVFSRVGSVDRNALIRPAEAGWLFSGRLLRVRPNRSQAYAPFLSYQFHSEPFKALVRNVAVGQTMASLNTKILKDINVRLPGLNEQIAIATVLSDMDTELAALEARRDKTRALKQGMMQELLTGRIRLV